MFYLTNDSKNLKLQQDLNTFFLELPNKSKLKISFNIMMKEV